MVSIRRWILAGIAILVSCEPGFAPAIRMGLERGQDRTGQWLGEAATAEVSTSTAIALAYLERLRLGMGSPFRLADQALQDPRLDTETRRDVAWAILGRTLAGSTYHIDDSVLAGSVPVPAAALASIEAAIISSPDPRRGEERVRAAYGSGAGATSPSTQSAARVAALIRDRELARRDAIRLLETSGAAFLDPLEELPAWRSARRFEVERPALSSRAPGPGIAPSADVIHAMTPAAARDDRQRTATARSLLPVPAAQRLAELGRTENGPPQPSVVVAMAARRASLLGDSMLHAAERSAREEFIANATSEERFVAGYALLRAHEADAAAGAEAALHVALAMRSLAQEPVWFLGFASPSPRDVERRYGLREIRFDEGIPAEWRPHFLHVLDVALSDLIAVLPALDLGDLRIEIGRAGIRPGMLALHDPRRSRLVLPPETGPGTIAHEIAHHLDGQVAVRKYGIRGDYASDGALRSPRDALALRFVDLAQVTVGETGASHANRPAEIFARSVEWFVATALAERGRSNGYLTSIQDEWIRGHGSARPLDADGNAAHALALLLDEVAPIHPMTRYAFLARYGRTDRPVPIETESALKTLALEPAIAPVPRDIESIPVSVVQATPADRPAPMNGRE